MNARAKLLREAVDAEECLDEVGMGYAAHWDILHLGALVLLYNRLASTSARGPFLDGEIHGDINQVSL